VYALDAERLDGASNRNFLEKAGEHMMGRLGWQGYTHTLT